MGAGQSAATFTYAQPIAGTEDAEHTQIYRDSAHPKYLVSDFSEGGHVKTEKDVHHPWGAFMRGCANSAKRPCLGHRPTLKDGTLSKTYSWMTFDQVKQKALNFGSGLFGLYKEEGGFPVVTVDTAQDINKANRFVGLMSKNRPEWLITDYACCAYNVCTVPLYDTLGDDAMVYICGMTELDLIVCAPELLENLLKIFKKSRTEDPDKVKVKKIILMGAGIPVSDTVKAGASSLDIKLYAFEDIVTLGGKSQMKPCPGGPNDLFTICYTSGTTGDPKGVIHTNGTWIGGVAGTARGPFQGRPPFMLMPSDVYISYLPLAHVYERVVTHCLMTEGASIGYYQGDVTKIVDDCQLLKPTVFCSVPRLYNRINDRIMAAVKGKSSLAQFLFNKGIDTKTTKYRRSGTCQDGLQDTLVFKKMKNLLGGRVRVMVTGSAPIDPLVQERMNLFMCAPLCQGFGMTETCGIGFVCHPADPRMGIVGGPFPNNEFRLEAVPDMNYLPSDQPRPRGELCVRGTNIFKGYYRNDEETAAALDADKWLHTGDICEVDPVYGSVKIVDRKKNIFKLVQGEYVAPERIEGVYNQCPLIGQIFVFGYSTKASLIAIVVPEETSVAKWNPSKGAPTAAFTKTTDSQDADLKKALMAEMDAVGQLNGLKGFEKVRDVYMSSELFSVENNLLTPTFKLKRKPAELRFKTQIDAMYEKLQ